MKSKYFLASFFLGLSLCVNAQVVNPGLDSELPTPCLKLNFDDRLDADLSGGNGKPFRVSPENVTIKEIFEPGIQGKALKCGHDKKSGKYYQYLWQADKNCSRAAGTVAFWVKPLDWDGNDTSPFRLFFCVTNGDERIQIFKPQNVSSLFLISGTIASPIRISADISNWRQGEWHLIAATWNHNSLTLYIDGEQIESTGNPKPVSRDFSYMQLGSQLIPAENGLTLFDEFRIYPVPLNQTQIRQIASEHADAIPVKQVLVISSAPRTVALDGKVFPGKYAFGGCCFYDIATGNPTTLPVQYFIAHDSKNIYIAFKSPAGNNKAEQLVRDGRIWEDDSIEIYLQPDIRKKKFFQFIVNSSGVYYDSTSTAQGKDWNCEGFKTASKNENGVWTIETLIPFASLGMDTPAPDAKWGINLCRSFQDKLRSVYCSLAKSYADVPTFASLVFKKSMPCIEIQSIGDLLKGKLAFETKVFGSNTADKSEIICEISSTERGRLFFSEKKILTSSVGSDVFKLSRDIPKAGQVKIEISSPEYGLLYNNLVNYIQKERFSLKFIYTDIQNQILHVITEAGLAKGDEIIVQLVEQDDKPVLEHRQKPGDSILYDIPLDISSVPPGDYRVVLKKSCEKNDGQIFEELFRKSPAKPVWTDNKFGVSDKVPPPWTDLLEDSNSVSCWGRKYNFDNAFLCSSIVSQGENILAAPMALRVNGKTEYVRDSFSLKLLSVKAGEVKFQQEARYGDLLANAEISVEFDGHVWVNMTLSSATGKPVAISDVILEIPIKTEFATLVHNSKRGYQIGASDASGAIPENGWRKNLFEVPAFWVGNEERGLNWFAENLKGWHCKAAEHSMTIEKGEKATIVNLFLVDSKMTLDKKREISFGFIATPARPINPTLMQDRNSQKFVTASDFWTKYQQLHSDKDGVNWNYIAKMPEVFKPKERIFYYSSYKGGSPFSADWGYWGKLWMRNPPEIGNYFTDTAVATKEKRNKDSWAYGCLRCKEFLDFKIWDLHSVLSDPRCGIKDWYFDLASPIMCGNQEHGCQWTDDFGRKYMTFDLLGTRELAKRLYMLIKEKKPDALIAQHLEGRRTSVMSFADRALDGEDLAPEVALAGAYYDLIKPDYYRASFIPQAWGMQYVGICQLYRGMLAFNPAKAIAWKDTPELRRAALHFLAYGLLHNSETEFTHWKYLFITTPLWSAQDKMGMDANVKFVPYWRKDRSIVTGPNSDRILSSVYVKQNKMFLVVLNDTSETQDVSVSLNLESIIPGVKVPLSWKGEEVFLQEKESILKNGTYSVSLPPRGMRLIYWE